MIAECVLLALHMLSVPWDLFAQVAVCGQACYHAYIVVIAVATSGSVTFAAGGGSHAKGITAQFPARSATTSVLTTYPATGATEVTRSVIPIGCVAGTRLVPNTISWDE